MSRYIDAEQIEKFIENGLNTGIFGHDAIEITTEIHFAPTADVVEVKHGYWTGLYDGFADGYPVYEEWECSNCGYVEYSEEIPRFNYCPNCGARMNGEI